MKRIAKELEGKLKQKIHRVSFGDLMHARSNLHVQPPLAMTTFPKKIIPIFLQMAIVQTSCKRLPLLSEHFPN